MVLSEGTKAVLEYKVEEKDLAKNLNISIDDDFPEVFATARLVALMEVSAAKILIPFLNESELSVGVGVDIKHLAATLCGDTAVSTATFVGMEGKLYKFEIEVKDSGGIIGTGTHTRAIVSNERLLSGAKKRVAK